VTVAYFLGHPVDASLMYKKR